MLVAPIKLVHEDWIELFAVKRNYLRVDIVDLEFLQRVVMYEVYIVEDYICIQTMNFDNELSSGGNNI